MNDKRLTSSDFICAVLYGLYKRNISEINPQSPYFHIGLNRAYFSLPESTRPIGIRFSQKFSDEEISNEFIELARQSAILIYTKNQDIDVIKTGEKIDNLELFYNRMSLSDFELVSKLPAQIMNLGQYK